MGIVARLRLVKIRTMSARANSTDVPLNRINGTIRCNYRSSKVQGKVQGSSKVHFGTETLIPTIAWCKLDQVENIAVSV